MSVASEESDLLARRQALSGELYAALDALWGAYASGDHPSTGEMAYAEDVLCRVDGD